VPSAKKKRVKQLSGRKKKTKKEDETEKVKNSRRL
jgi:hypothetical protein